MSPTKEKSCGVVVYRLNENGEKEFLLLHYPGGHWDFPKGHVEKDEDEHETAKREVLEETGIKDLEFVEPFRERVEYYYQRDHQLYSKEVIFFIAETKTKKITLSFEHQGYDWLPYKETIEKLTFENTKRILKKAQQFFETQVE